MVLFPFYILNLNTLAEEQIIYFQWKGLRISSFLYYFHVNKALRCKTEHINLITYKVLLLLPQYLIPVVYVFPYYGSIATI